MIRVLRVDPERMVVEMNPVRCIVRERATTVRRPKQVRAAEIHPLRIIGVDPYLGVVHGAVVRSRPVLPRIPAIRRAIDAVLDIVLAPSTEPLTGAARIRLNQSADQIPVTAVDIQPDAPFVALRQTFSQFDPCMPTVRAPVDPAAGPTAVVSPCLTLPLIHRRKERLWIIGVHRQVDGAGMCIDEQHLIPTLATVHRAIDATLRVRTPEVTHRRHVGHIGIFGMHLNSRDVMRILEPEVRPALTSVRGAVHSITPR